MRVVIRSSKQRRGGLPRSQEEIAAACAAIRAGWTEADIRDQRSRRGVWAIPPGWMPPRVTSAVCLNGQSRPSVFDQEEDES